MTKYDASSPQLTLQQPPQGFRLEEHEGFLRMYVHGEFENVEDNSKFVEQLNKMSDKYSIIEIWISSPGGYVSLLIEIIEAVKKFRNVVTICNSTAASAGAMLWCLGNVRVISKFSQIMWHRESYGYYGKTAQHEDYLEHQKETLTELFEHCVGDVITDEEKAKALYTEVWRSGKRLIEEGFAISYEDYCDRMESVLGGRFTEVGTIFHDNVTGKTILSSDEGICQTIGHIELSPYQYAMFDIGVSDNVRTAIEDSEGETTALLSMEQFEQYEKKFIDLFEEVEQDSDEVVEDEDEDPLTNNSTNEEVS